MPSRQERVKAFKSELRDRRFSRFAILASTLFLAITIGLSAIVYVKYNTSEKWTDSKLSGKEADIPPEFAKNTYSATMLKDIDSLGDVTEILNTISHDGGITPSTITSARKALSQSQRILSSYHVTGGESLTNQNNLKLDIQAYDVEQHAYTNPDSKALNYVINEITKRNLTTQNATDQKILARLNNISRDYEALNTFVDKYIGKLGTINGKLVTVNKSVDSKLTNEMINDSNQHHLNKFNNIKKLQTLLLSSDWQKIMNNNQSLSEHEKWLKTVAVFRSLTQSEYFDSSDLQTLADAKKINASVDSDVDRDGYKLLDISPIIAITVDGNVVHEDQYIKKDASVTVQISPIYENLNPVSSDSSSSSSSASSSTIMSSSSSSSTNTSHNSSTNRFNRRPNSKATSTSSASSTSSNISSSSSSDSTSISSSSSSNDTIDNR